MAKKILIILGVLILILVLALGYLGFLPWLSSVFGSDRPRDLGVRPMPQDLDSAMTKLAVQAMPPVVDDNTRQQLIADAAKKRPKLKVPSKTEQPQPTPGPTKPSGPVTSGTFIQVLVTTWQPQNVDVVLTSAEVTGLLQTGTWKSWPISNVQILINGDGSAEMVGLISVNRLYIFAGRTGIPTTMIDDFFEYVKFKHDFPFYIKSRGQIDNNKVQMVLEEVEIGRLSIPSSVLNQYQGEITSFVQTYLVQGGIAKQKKFSVKSMKAENGKLRFVGTIPNASPHWTYKDLQKVLIEQNQ